VFGSWDEERPGTNGQFHGFVIWHDPNCGDDPAAGAAGEVVPRVGTQAVGLALMLHEGLMALAVFAVSFLA